MANNKTTGLLLLGGATLFFLTKGSGASETKTSQSGGSGGGLILVPSSSGFGTGEVSSPIYKLPDVVINESPFPNVGTSESSSTTSKKSVSASMLKDQPIYDKGGNLVGIQDSILKSNPQSRLPTASEKLIYSKKQNSTNVGDQLMSTIDGVKKVSEVYPQTATKKESSKKWYNPISWF